MNQLNVYRLMIICKRVKKQVLDKYRGGSREKYVMLYRYAKELRRSNKGSTVEVLPIRLSGHDKPKFKCMYVCFNACK